MYKQINQNSFFGNFLYERVIPENHFLKRLVRMVDFSFINDLCRDCYDNLGGSGNRPYEPVLLFKMLFLTILYDISDRDIEEQVSLNLAFKWFVGLPADAVAPDHSTLTYFRERLGNNRFNKIFDHIVKQAKGKGLIDDKIKIIDSTHIEAKVDTHRLTREFKEKLDKEPDKLDNQGINRNNYVDEESPDKDARFGRKSDAKSFYGYKQHTRIDANSEIIEKIIITPGNRKDDQLLGPLLDDIPGSHEYTSCNNRKNKENQRKIKIVADKGYDSIDNHRLIERKRHCQSFIMLRKNRVEPKFRKRMKSLLYKKVVRQRYKIERRFADGKNNHGLGRCRWLGQFKTEIQTFLTAIVLNCKRIVVLLLQNLKYSPI